MPAGRTPLSAAPPSTLRLTFPPKKVPLLLVVLTVTGARAGRAGRRERHRRPRAGREVAVDAADGDADRVVVIEQDRIRRVTLDPDRVDALRGAAGLEGGPDDRAVRCHRTRRERQRRQGRAPRVAGVAPVLERTRGDDTGERRVLRDAHGDRVIAVLIGVDRRRRRHRVREVGDALDSPGVHGREDLVARAVAGVDLVDDDPGRVTVDDPDLVVRVGRDGHGREVRSGIAGGDPAGLDVLDRVGIHAGRDAVVVDVRWRRLVLEIADVERHEPAEAGRIGRSRSLADEGDDRSVVDRIVIRGGRVEGCAGVRSRAGTGVRGATET